MGRKAIEKRYNEMVANIENWKMYDGRGTIDKYVCRKCGNVIYTTYKDKGVTPFTIRCNKCGSTMEHEDTLAKAPEGAVVKNWYRPTLKNALRKGDGVLEHVLNGGLLLEV